MGQGHHFEIERPDIEMTLQGHDVQRHLPHELRVFQLAAKNRRRERRGVYSGNATVPKDREPPPR